MRIVGLFKGVRGENCFDRGTRGYVYNYFLLTFSHRFMLLNIILSSPNKPLFTQNLMEKEKINFMEGKSKSFEGSR